MFLGGVHVPTSVGIVNAIAGPAQSGYLSQYQVYLGFTRCNGLVLGMAKCLPLSGVLPRMSQLCYWAGCAHLCPIKHGGA